MRVELPNRLWTVLGCDLDAGMEASKSIREDDAVI